MNSIKNYYEILGINRNATQDEIKHAYRNLAKRYHPDHNSASGAAEIFRRIQEAYEVLSNEESRQSYDRKLSETESTRHESLVSRKPKQREHHEEKSYLKSLWKSLFIAGMLGVTTAYVFYFMRFTFGISALRHSLLHPLEYVIQNIQSSAVFATTGILMLIAFFALAHIQKFRHYAGEFCIILFLGLVMITGSELITGNGHLLVTDAKEERLFSYAENGTFEQEFGAPVRKIKYSKAHSEAFIEEVGIYNGLHYFVRLTGGGHGSMIGQGEQKTFNWSVGTEDK